MIDYETFCRIKLLHERHGLNACQIARELYISPITVRKKLREETYIPRSPAKRGSILDPWKERIREMVRHHDYSNRQIFRILKEDGYPGGITTLRDYIAMVRPSKRPAFLTLSFHPGEAAQVDFAYTGYINIDGKNKRLYAMVITLCYSRMMIVKFIMRQNMEHFLQCQRDAFEELGGVTAKVIVDNCKVAVSRVSRHGDAILNPKYVDFSRHCGFQVVPCNPHQPNEKGIVERAVSYLRQSFLRGLEITSLEAVNHGVQQWLDTVANVRIHGTTKKRPIDMFEQEKQYLRPLPQTPYDCCTLSNPRVSSQFRVRFETNQYSVPAEYAQRTVSQKTYVDRLEFHHMDKLIAVHPRYYGEHRDFENPDHVRELLRERRTAREHQLISGFLAISKDAEAYYHGLKGKRLRVTHHIKKIMALAERYGYEAVERAIKDALQLQAFSSDYIANIIEQRQRRLPEPGPLHVTRKADCLDIELEQPDLDMYEPKQNRKEATNDSQ